MPGPKSPPAHGPAQPAGTAPGLPPLSFPEQPAGPDPQPEPGAYSPQPGGPPNGLAPGQPSGPWATGQPQPGAGPRARYRQPAPPPSRPPDREIRHRAIAGLIFALLSVIALLGAVGNLHRGIYLVIFSLLAGAGGFVLGVTALRRARRAGAWRPRGAIAAMIIGALSTVFGIMTLVAFTLFSAQLATYSQCLSRAQTPSAQQACLTQLQRAIDARLHQPGS